MPTVTDTNDDTDDDTKRADQLDQQYKWANTAITGLSDAISHAKTTIAETETALSHANASHASDLQTKLDQLRTQLAKDEAAFAIVMSAKAGSREGKVDPEPSFADILRVSGCSISASPTGLMIIDD